MKGEKVLTESYYLIINTVSVNVYISFMLDFT